MSLLGYFLFTFTKFFIIIIPVLISVAYLILAKRKVLGYIQTRKGPNVVGIYGVLQPLAESVKLFSKEMVIPNHVNIILYLFSPKMALSLSLIVWSLLPFGETSTMADINLGLLLIFAFSSVSVYTILISGWSSNSKYAFLGALSVAAQIISYEVCIGLIIINVILRVGAFNLNLILITQTQSVWFLIPLLPAGLMFFISCLAETNRAPFDLTERESELVSGCNVEYSSMSFALFFLAEYSHIIFMSFLITILFLGGSSMMLFNSILLSFVKASLVVLIFVWVTTSFPRLRYDQLMYLLWKTYLPLSLGMIILTNSILWFSNGLPVKLCI